MPLNTEPPRMRHWLANRFLRFVALLVIVGLVAYVWFGRAGFGDRSTTVGAERGSTRDEESPAPAVRFSAPRSIPGTPVRLITVHHERRKLLEAFGVGGVRDYSYGSPESPTVNVLFFDPATSVARLLLDRRALIASIDAPDRGDSSVRRTISYRIVFADADGNGELEEEDSELWVSDVEGRDLRRASPEGAVVRSATFMEDGKRILIFAVDRAPDNRRVSKEQMPQRAFVYDIASDGIRSLTQLDSLAIAAGQVVTGH